MIILGSLLNRMVYPCSLSLRRFTRSVYPKSKNWGYGKTNGPHRWGEWFPDALGKRQTPIDIKSAQAVYDKNLLKKMFSYRYQQSDSFKIINTGKSFQVATTRGKEFFVKGGPLEHTYILEQFHFHWGEDNHVGSEHLIDGRAFPSELHLVHWNSDRYNSFSEAVNKSDGLCVLGVFIKIGNENKALEKLVRKIPQIEFSDESVSLKESFNPADLLPDGGVHFYWTYPGSLTTPPCHESVTWILFEEPISVSENQLQQFRNLRSHVRGENCNDEFGGCILQNYRPCFPLGDRTLRSTIFKH